MKKLRWIALLLCVALAFPALSFANDGTRTLSLDTYRDKMRAAWLGKMVGVSVGILREFWHRGEIAPEKDVPSWDPALLSLASVEDDIYIPFVLLQELAKNGMDLSGRDMAVALYPYSFEFWNGHLYTFECGVAPPDAGHPTYAPFPDGLSYSFAADYSGLIAPGRPDIPMELADRFGSMLVYGDGIYGGAYIGALYSEAFFTQDMQAIVKSALAAVPEDSWLSLAVRDVLDCYAADPEDWEAAWQQITQTYFLRADYNWIQWPYGGRTGGINLDAKLNCAYITIALLYGQGDIEKTLSLAIRCGQDCDSNAANALGVLFTTLGWEQVPQTYKESLKDLPPIRYADASFEDLVAVTEQVALEAIASAGAILDAETWTIPAPTLTPGAAQNSKRPDPVVGSQFTAEEMRRMVKPALQDGGFEADWHDTVYPPWMVSGSGTSGLDIRAGKAYTGVNNAWISATAHGTMALTQHRIEVLPESTYLLSCYVRSSADFEGGILEATAAGNPLVSLGKQTFAGPEDYTRIELVFTTGDIEVLDISIRYTGETASSWMQIDDVALVLLEDAP